MDGHDATRAVGVPVQYDEGTRGETAGVGGASDELRDVLGRAREDHSTPTVYLTGLAGSGKTHQLKELGGDHTLGLELCSSTGISAVNLGVRTIHSTLGYYDTESLQANYARGILTRKIRQMVKKGARWIGVDENSMLAGHQLDTLYLAVEEINQGEGDSRRRVGIILSGDYAQLPVIVDKKKAIVDNQCYEAECWEKFEPYTVRLTKNWRQGDGEFLTGVNLIRRGDGVEGAEAIKHAGVEFVHSMDMRFDGTTIVATNQEVDRHNAMRLLQLSGEKIVAGNRRKGKATGEWKLIPDEFVVKRGAYVMILANDSPWFTFANGDCGWVEDYANDRFVIRLARNNQLVSIGRITRHTLERDLPDAGRYCECRAGVDDQPGRPLYDPGADVPNRVHGVNCEVVMEEKSGKWVVGEVEYFPLRLAYASTTFKSQGISLDRVQIDPRHHFFGSPHQAYVAVSRCRTAQGMRVVGTPELLGKRVKLDEKVRRWI